MASSSFSPNGAAFDAIVIGSGAGGLTAATRLVQSGLRVALLEKNSWLGGMSHGWDEDGYHWDHGGHIFMGYRLGGKSRELFKRLGLDKRVEMVPVRLDYQCMFPGDALSIEAEITQTVDSFSARFPHEREGIARLFQTIQQIAAEAETSVPAFQIPARPGQRGLLDPVKDSMTYPILGKMAAAMTGATRMPGAALLKYQFKTMKEMIEEHVTDQRLRGYLGMIAGGMSASPAVCSAVVAAVFFVESLQVMWMPKGGFAKIGEGLLGSFQELGGHVFTSAEATHILMENDHVAGVETADGRRFMANFVISNAELVGRRVPTIASLNPIMIDGIGMCGGCRVLVGGATRFACVEGPEFDAHQVDFEDLARRNRAYSEQERRAILNQECRIVNPILASVSSAPQDLG